MGSIFRSITIYFLLLLLFRLSGKRSLAETTTFDLVLLLIISEAIQQAMLDSDNSLTNAALTVGTLVGVDIALSLLKQRSTLISCIIDGLPVVIMRNQKLDERAMHKERVCVEDILESARELQGVGRIEDVRHAVIENSGVITIVPVSKD